MKNILWAKNTPQDKTHGTKYGVYCPSEILSRNGYDYIKEVGGLGEYVPLVNSLTRNFTVLVMPISMILFDDIISNQIVAMRLLS